MEIQQIVALVALGWLFVSLFLMGQSIRRGRELVETLAQRHPNEYEALGRPRPGYLQSARRDRFARYVARREFEQLDDPVLAGEFEAFRLYERRLVISLIASMLVVFLLVLYVRYVV